MLDPKDLSHRLGWIGAVTFFTDGNSLYDGVTYKEAFGSMVSSMEKRENKTGKKVQCKKIKSDKKRCKVKTSSKSGYCYYHD